MMRRKWIAGGLAVAIMWLAMAPVWMASGQVMAKDALIAQVPTATPAQINLSPVASPVQLQDLSGPTPTRTATPQGIALLEAKDFANVRAQPSTDSAQLGTIKAGEKYNVIGRYVSWIQFEYSTSPTGKGWVFGDLVTLSGNIDNIPDINPYAQESVDNSAANATATQNILTQTPGGVLTATVLSRVAGGTTVPQANGTPEILPTFTYPPGMVAIAPTQAAPTDESSLNANTQAAVPTSNNNGLPPVLPILLLGGVGVLGLVINSLRRG